MLGGMTGDELRVRGILIPAAELSWRFSRASGPGGQGVNTTDSRVQLVFDLAASPSIPAHLRDRAVERLGGRLAQGCIVVTASEHRSQLLNREAAMRRMAAILSDALGPGPRPRRPTKPTRASAERRLKAKKGRSQVKRLRQGRPDAD